MDYYQGRMSLKKNFVAFGLGDFWPYFLTNKSCINVIFANFCPLYLQLHSYTYVLLEKSKKFKYAYHSRVTSQ